MYGDKESKKYSDESRKKLEIFEINKLPLYILLKDNLMSMPTLYIMQNSEILKCIASHFSILVEKN